MVASSWLAGLIRFSNNTGDRASREGDPTSEYHGVSQNGGMDRGLQFVFNRLRGSEGANWIRTSSGVESRMGAGTDAERRPGSHPRSSNRTCLFRASGFPTGFIVDSRTCGPWPSEPKHPQAVHTSVPRRTGACLAMTPCAAFLRKFRTRSYTYSSTARYACLVTPAGKVLPPALQLLVQLLTALPPKVPRSGDPTVRPRSA